MYFIYNLFLMVIFLLLFPFLYFWAITGKHGVLERLGKLPREAKGKFVSKKVLWFHTASVGEIRLLPPIIVRLKKKDPAYSIVVSTVTKAGRKEGERSLRGVDLVFYLPIDLPFLIKRVLKKLNPTALLLVETEIWPNLIREAKIHRTRVALINGRLSHKSLGKYLRFKSFFSSVLSFFDLCCMRTEEDAERFILLGVDPKKVKVAGNLKYDTPISDHGSLNPDNLKRSLGIPQDSNVVVAGSTEEGEERMILNAFKKLKLQHPDLCLILAPRHLNRIKQVEKELFRSKLKYQKRTQINNEAKARINLDVILLDTIGELFSLYSVAQVAFVGGSLIPFGGHNVLEPAVHSVPVLFGPHMDHFRQSSELLVESGGGIVIESDQELFLKISELLRNEDKRKKMGKMARNFIEKHQGPADKTVDLLLPLITKK